MPATTPATITVRRCRAFVGASSTVAAHYPTSHADSSAEFTPMARATTCRSTVRGMPLALVSATATVRQPSPVIPAVTLEDTLSAMSVCTIATTVLGTTSTDNVTPTSPACISSPVTLVPGVPDITTPDSVTTRPQTADIRIAQTVHATVTPAATERPTPALTSADIMTSINVDVSTTRALVFRLTSHEAASATNTEVRPSHAQPAHLSEESTPIIFAITHAITTKSTAVIG